ncbi:type 1 glutamine amidotransferase domain-containing protein [Haloarcula rubripromontorii]|uniref:Type 1 glutamine amidotransferase domain-containing protein n=1 Tax=Haloarcula rubripromontorii TaxID=1705562 RepID=A0A847TXK5_9EURY|nr:type 1 glutamine amidotransferase domain-containing protein [Haloarcula rubripromontorii]NLV05067.1 type 1 glutamine amidotransferase domain-containing protein [Haloarcula rubripromontorii]
MSSALFVVSEHGYWGEECIEPLTTLSDAGLDITVATPTGEPPVLDERSVDPDEVGEDLSEHVREVHETDERLNNPIPLAQADADDYDTVVFPGGHGAEWDITQDTHARELLRESVAGDDGKALVVCHTVGILAFTRDSDGEFLVDGRSVTGFPNAWEEGIVDENDLLPDGRKLPYWVEDEVKAAGADWDAELDADTSVTVDGDLITARGPPSSAEAARTLLDELGIETSA